MAFSRILPIATALVCASSAALAMGAGSLVLPSGWRLSPPAGATATVGTMPQGIAISPNGALLALVESGVGPPALRVLDAGTLRERARVVLRGAFGRPVWIDDSHVAVAGANADAQFVVDVTNSTVSQTALPAGSWPAAIAVSRNGRIATAQDGDGSVLARTSRAAVGAHPSDLIFSNDGRTIYAAVRGSNTVAVLDADPLTVRKRIAVGKHPAALALSADGSRLYVAESDDDSVGVIDTRSEKVLSHITVGLHSGRLSGYGASPNALLVRGADLFVSLGGENAVAIVRDGRVLERIPAGWYPTGIAAGKDRTLYVSNGKGERAPANPQFNPFVRDSGGYVGAITTGSVRAIPYSAYAGAAGQSDAVLADAQPQWTQPPASRTVLRPNGPIRHVIYVIKENRSYDQVLGDLVGANGDRKLVMFGQAITPNQHALARRFGVFDNAFVDAQVSADGHNWTDAAFANDYVERFWPPNYGNRRKTYDFQEGNAPDVPHNGYLWDAAQRAHITYRDYGEDLEFPPHGPKIAFNTFPGLAGHFDPRYAGWDLRTSDDARYAEWLREFRGYVSAKTLPQLEIVYLPNDHTAATAPGMPTPQAYLAMNDWAVGRLVQAVSHSPYWRSTAIFILEDDAQNGPDHVSDQRSTFYIASPYARGGVQHGHYSTAGFVHTIELLLGMRPLSIYDATAQPLYGAFSVSPANWPPFNPIAPSVRMDALNTKTAYGSATSAHLDFREPDRVDSALFNTILQHTVRN